MARQQPNKPKSTEFVGYVKWYLNDDMKQAVQTNLPKDKDMIARIEKYAETDLKFSAGWDNVSDCYQVSLYDQRKNSPSQGWVLATRHTDFVKAFGLLVHLHEVVYADGWDIERNDVKNLVSW
jgi:hypothetical protein